jgi:hypothetical protein
MKPTKDQAMDQLISLFATEPEYRKTLKSVISQVIEGKLSDEAAAKELSRNPKIQSEIVQMFKKGRACKYAPDIAAVLHPHFKVIKTLQAQA